MELKVLHCPECESPNLKIHSRYSTRSGKRLIYACECCGQKHSETYGSPAFNLKTPLSKVAAALKLRSEGMGLRATGRCLDCSKRDISTWENRFAEQKSPLQLYGQLHQYICLTFEGDLCPCMLNIVEETGTRYIEVPTRKVKPSQTCSGCGSQERKPLQQRKHNCPCGTQLSRDENAARVILNWAG